MMYDGGGTMRARRTAGAHPAHGEAGGARIDTVLWSRLDGPGHEACRLVRRTGAWRLEGTAVFRHLGLPACLAYEVDCDDRWRTLQAVVHGWVGARRLERGVTRTPVGVWTLDGVVVSRLKGCVDLDLGFTPATNLVQLRRLALRVGEAATFPVAWLDPVTGTLDVLPQRYERRTAGTYWYEAPRFGYAGLLRVSAVGFVEEYPGLWQAEQGRASKRPPEAAQGEDRASEHRRPPPGDRPQANERTTPHEGRKP